MQSGIQTAIPVRILPLLTDHSPLRTGMKDLDYDMPMESIMKEEEESE